MACKVHYYQQWIHLSQINELKRAWYMILIQLESNERIFKCCCANIQHILCDVGAVL